MNKIETKLLLFLSNPELTDSDFDQLVELLYRRDFKELLSAADHLRHVSRDMLRDTAQSRVPDELVKHIQTMLIKDGGMSPTSAVRQLLAELRDEPFPIRKWTIRSGLEFALRFASESEIVTAAQRVLAKKSAGANKHAWTLNKPLH